MTESGQGKPLTAVARFRRKAGAHALSFSITLPLISKFA